MHGYISLVVALRKRTKRNLISSGEKKKANGFRSQRVKIWFEILAKGFKTRATARAVIDSSEKVYVYRDSRSRGRKWLG